jgi:DNA-binding protein YbaB
MSIQNQTFQQAWNIFTQISDRLESEHVTGSSGGNLVQVRVNGHGTVQEISVQWEHQVIKNQPEIVTDLITTATNDAIEKVGTFGMKSIFFKDYVEIHMSYRFILLTCSWEISKRMRLCRICKFQSEAKSVQRSGHFRL